MRIAKVGLVFISNIRIFALGDILAAVRTPSLDVLAGTCTIRGMETPQNIENSNKTCISMWRVIVLVLMCSRDGSVSVFPDLARARKQENSNNERRTLAEEPSCQIHPPRSILFLRILTVRLHTVPTCKVTDYCSLSILPNWFAASGDRLGWESCCGETDTRLVCRFCFTDVA